MVLSHDVPIALERNYSTADDILAVVESYMNSSATSSDNTLGGSTLNLNLSLALCFKSAPSGVCSDSPSEEALDWLDLVDKQLERASAIQARHSRGSLEIVIDGDGTPGGSTSEDKARKCLFSRWGMFPSTYIPGRDPAEALDSSAGALASFTFLNPSANADELASLEIAGFGRFGSPAHRPMTVWEPSDEATINGLATQYVNSGSRMDGGFLFATNQDPVQQELYLSSTGTGTGRAWHGPLVEASSNVRQTHHHTSPYRSWHKPQPRHDLQTMLGRSPRVVLLNPSNRLLIVWLESKQENARWTVSVSSSPIDDPAVSGGIPPTFELQQTLLIPNQDVVAVSATVNDSIVITTQNGTHLLLQSAGATAPVVIGHSSSSFDAPAESVLVSSNLAGDIVLSLWASNGINQPRGLLRAGHIGNNCLLYFDAIGLSDGSIMGTGCAVSNQGVGDIHAITSVSAAVVKSQNSSSTLQDSGCSGNDGVFFTLADDVKTVFAGGLCVIIEAGSLPQSATVAVKPMPGLQNALTPIGIGTDSTISVANSILRGATIAKTQDGVGAVFETHTDGFCWNMEARNKAPLPLVCDSQPSSTAGVMVYNFAHSTAEWVSALNGIDQQKSKQKAPKTASELLSSCHGSVLHGAFGLGGKPASELMWSPSTDRFVQLAVHEAWQESHDSASLACGAPLAQPNGTLVFDAWTWGSNHQFSPSGRTDIVVTEQALERAIGGRSDDIN